MVRAAIDSRASGIACEACGGDLLPAQGVGGYRYDGCVRCRYVQLRDETPEADVFDIYSDSYFHGNVAGGYDDYLSEGALLCAAGRRYGSLLERFGPVGDLLDIGSAAGFMVAGLRDAGWRARGLELNARMSRWGRRMLNVEIDTQSLERFESSQQFDAVTMVQVVAHFYDLASAFENAARLTKTGGLWLIETWNARSLTARFFRAQWHEFNPPSVRRIFTPENLTIAASRFGMRQIALGRPTKRILTAHAKSLVAQKAQTGSFARALVRMAALLPDNLVLPYPAEDLFWALYRKTD